MVVQLKVKPTLNSNWVDNNALKILQTLQGKNHTTYLVGGCVRDLLIGIEPKDYDIVTTARPEEVRKYISHAYVIGRRFKLVLVKRGQNQYEVSTFRSNQLAEGFDEDVDDIDKLYGTPEEDAQRRDFTVNGLFYDPYQEKIIDFTDGLSDIGNRKIKMIGDPIKRIQEDPIRTLRALRLAHKINFSLSTDLRAAMKDSAQLLESAVLPRKREEFLKILRVDNAIAAILEAYDLDILKYTLPSLHDDLGNSNWFENFTIFLSKGINQNFDKNNPTLLFGLFTFAYLSARDEEFFNNFNSDRDDSKNENLRKFFRDELGMFKLEQEVFMQALNLIAYIRDNKLNKLKHSQVAHVIKNNGFELAMFLAHSYHLLHHSLIHSWWKIYKDTYGKKL